MRRRRAVDRAVVGGEGCVQARFFDDFVGRGFCQHLLGGTDGEDGGLRRIDDRLKGVDSEHAQVRDRNGTARIVLGLQLASTSARDQRVQLACKHDEGLGRSIPDDRGDEPAGDGDGDGDIDPLEMLHALVCPSDIDGDILLRASLERQRERLDHKIVERDLEGLGWSCVLFCVLSFL